MPDGRKGSDPRAGDEIFAPLEHKLQSFVCFVGDLGFVLYNRDDLGGAVLKETDHKAEDKKAGHESKKTKDTMEDIYRDDALK